MNQIEVRGDGKIYLYTNRGKRPLLIGVLNHGVLTVKRNAKFIFRKTQSIGLNAEMVALTPFIILCVLMSTGERLLTTKQYLLEKAEHRQHANFESQYFMRIADFGIEAALAWERRRRIRDVSIFEIFPPDQDKEKNEP